MATIEKVSYTHDAMIDCIIANPSVTGAQLAVTFGFTQAWISQVVSSDAFKARLAERKGDLVDPGIAATVEERMEGLLRQSMDVVQEKLMLNKDADLAMKGLEVTAKALGFGARDKQAAVNASFVVVMPAAVSSVEEWQKQNSQTIDVQATEVVNNECS